MGNRKTKIKFVDVKKYGFITEPRYYFWGWSNSPKILARNSAVKALIRAKRFLPKGYNFKIWDCQRPRQVNELMIKSFWRRIKYSHPKLSKKEVKKLVIRFAGPVPSPKRETKLWTHRTGGAVDLTLVDRSRKEAYMGTDHDDLSERAALGYFDKKKNLSALDKIAKKNRRILIRAMKKAGFGDYKYEWWHWWIDK